MSFFTFIIFVIEKRISSKFNQFSSLSIDTSVANFARRSVHQFLCKVANRQTDKQTNKRRALHNLLGGGN